MRRALVLSACALLLGACQTVLSTNRAEPGQIVTVTPDYNENQQCVEDSPVEIRILPRDQMPVDPDPLAAEHEGMGEEIGTGTAAADGWFEIAIEAPADLGDYAVWAECNGVDYGNEQAPNFDRFVFDPDQLVVHAPLLLTATPTEVEAGATVTISGPWCVSQLPEGESPVVAVTFAGETHTLEADAAQPFDEVWELEVTAPDEGGTYTVTATCSYDDGVEEEEPGIPVAAIVAAEYEPTEVIVSAQATTTTSTPAPSSTTSVTPTTTPATGPRAVVAQPNYTG